MSNAVNLWPLIGVAVIIAGFVLRFNPMLVVACAALVTAFAAGFPLERMLAAIGTGFIKTRNLPLILFLPLAVIGLLAPLVEGTAEVRYGKLPDAIRYKLRAYCATTDNMGLFFGEDLFVAFGAIVLMTIFLHEAGIDVEPIRVAVWGIPTALCAFAIHAWRLHCLDKSLERDMAQHAPVGPAEGAANATVASGAGV